MRLTKSLLKEIVKEELLNSQGLTTDFQEDDIVKDINPDCPHFKSQGIVIKVTPKDVTYQVTNNGKTYKDGDELTKTKDQLVKLNTNEIDEDFSVGNRKDRVSQTKKTAEVLGNKMVGEVEEPTWDLTKNKDRGDQLGESKIPLNEIRKKFFIHKISDSRLKNILLKAISKLSGGKVLKMGDDYIHLDIESKYMDVLGDFIKKYDKKRNVVIIDQFKDVVYNGKKGINKLREGIDVRKWMKAVEKGEDVVVYDKKGKRYNLQGGNNKEVQVTDHWEDAGRRNIHPEKTWQTLPLSKVKKIVSEGKLSEGRFRLSSGSEMHWGSDKLVIMAGNKKIVLNKKELKNMVRGLKMHRLGEGKLNERPGDSRDWAFEWESDIAMLINHKQLKLLMSGKDDSGHKV